jgi:hypothetical protein
MAGFGSFVGGFERGYQGAEAMSDRQSARERQDRMDEMAIEDRDRLHTRQDANDEWLATNRAYTTSERQRTADERDWYDDLMEESAAMTDAAIAADNQAVGGQAPEGNNPGVSTQSAPPNQPPSLGATRPRERLSQPQAPDTRGPAQPQSSATGGLDVQVGGSAGNDQMSAAPAMPQAAGRGTLPASVNDRSGSSVAPEAVMNDPAFVMQAEQRSMSPQGYWDSLDENVRQHHQQRLSRQGQKRPEPGEDRAFDQRAVDAASNILENGMDLTATDMERLRALIAERSPPEGVEPAGAQKSYAMEKASQSPMAPPTPEAGTAPSMPRPGTPMGASRQPSQMATPTPGPQSFAAPQEQAPLQPQEQAPAAGSNPEFDARLVSSIDQMLEAGTSETGQPLTEQDRSDLVAMRDTRSQPAAAPQPQGTGTRQGDQQRVAEQASSDWVDEHMRVGIPHMAEQLMRRGKIEEAQALTDWAREETTRQGMQDYAKAAFGASVGDFDMFGQSVMDLYNNEDYYKDGLTMDRENSGFSYDENGQVDGAQVTFNDENGDSFVRTYESMTDLVNEALLMLNPEAAFQTQIDRQEGATQALVGAAEDEADFADFMRRELFKDGLGDDDNAALDDAVKAARDSAQWMNASTEQKLEMVKSELAVMEQARSSMTTRPGSVGAEPDQTPTPQPQPRGVTQPAGARQPDNILRR